MRFTGSRLVVTGSRAAVGTAVSVLAVLGVVGSIAAPWPQIRHEPVQLDAVPTPAASILACPGDLLAIGRDIANVEAITPAAPQNVVFGSSDPARVPDETRLTSDEVEIGPAAFVAEPVGTERVDIAAASSTAVVADDLTGYAATACRPPLLESWLVAGSASTGASDLVVLNNPGSVPATVQLTVFGAEGESVPGGGEAVIVPPLSQRVLPLSGLAFGEASLVIRVTATGAPVQASLQASIVRVLAPGGVDQVGAVPEPAQVAQVLGVQVTEDPGDGTGNVATVVRMLSASTDAEATVTVTDTATGAVVREEAAVPLRAGVPTQVGLPGLSPGSYRVGIEATDPVVAAVWQAAGFAAGADFAWYLPSPTISQPSLFAVPGGATATMMLHNPGAQPLEVVLAATGGGVQTVTVPAGGDAAVPVEADVVYALDPGSGALQAGVGLAGPGALAAFPVWPADAAAPAITVYP